MKNKVLFIGRFTPPVHGAALMNENYFNSPKIGKDFVVKNIKINYSSSLERLGKLNFIKFVGVFIAIFKLFFSLIFFRPRLIYFEIAPNGLAFYRDSLLVLICKIFRKKVLFHLHARNVTRNFYSKLIFSNSKIIILSNLLYSEVEGLFDKKDVFVMPNGLPDQIDSKVFNQILKDRMKNKKLEILFLSNMIEEKGALDTLKICESLKGKMEFECKFAGAWESEEFKKRWTNYLEEHHLNDVCKYVGPKYGQDKKELLSKANVLVFPTKYKNESFPLVIIEAFMYGIPVVAYSNGAISEIISSKTLGFVEKDRNLNALAEQIKKIKNNPSDSKKIREIYKKEYGIDVASANLNKIFNKLIT